MIGIKINGNSYVNFNDVSINLEFDSIASTFEVNAYFDPENEQQRALFKPLSYNSIEIYEDEELLLTGTIISQNMSASDTNQLVPLSGYSKTGVLNDCPVGQSNYPLQFDNKTLVEITEALISPFGLSLVVDNSVAEQANKIYEQEAIKPQEPIARYLASLCAQRNITLSHTAAGEVYFTASLSDQRSIATYREGQPSVKIGMSVNGQVMHSEIAVLKQATIGEDIESDGVLNNDFIPAYRPTVKEQNKGDSEDSENAAKKARANELKAINITVNSDRWIWYNGEVVSLIRPNNYIDIISANIFLPNRTNVFVKSVTLSESANKRKATLICVVPESFNGNDPVNIFS